MQNKNNFLIDGISELIWIILNAFPLIIAVIIFYVLGLESDTLNKLLYADASFFLFWWYLALLLKNLELFESSVGNKQLDIGRMEKAIFQLAMTLAFLAMAGHLVFYVLARIDGIDLFKSVEMLELTNILYISLSIMLILKILTFYIQKRITNLERVQQSYFLGLDPNSHIQINL